ncbi:methyltransferase-like protein 17, mitochondrial [Anoplophora glabripennis]|uniref:methyltransferase-like protein 17, mitochondrial n=1 Tax=Anoplophora glabripennis TaxID=217634 RepID=UPI0008757A81|nr:methyltransferase-like protein 17, mitochondrial [Anoplophora glabripennis]
MQSFKIMSLTNFVCKYSVKVRPIVVTDENVLNKISDNVFRPRKHPGVMNPKTVTLPEEFVKAIACVTEDYPIKTLHVNSQKLSRHLKGRVPPMEKEEIKNKTQEMHAKVLSKFEGIIIENEEDEKRFQQMVQNKVNNILREKIYNWKPINYDAYNSLLYLLVRAPPEYAVLIKIFGEISSRDPEFKPKSLFDFGSGVGTASWAAQMYWKNHIFEYFNVDSSRDMNDLALILLQGGRGTGNLPKGTFYRQFLPASKVTYDLVTCAYSLLELPSLEARLQTLVNLWNKTERYLVIVEQGTNAGFKVINEIRDFILQVQDGSNKGHVFSPCPHDETCPRFLLDDGTPCNFEVRYFTLPVGQISQSKTELYSYVVLKKGMRGENDLRWPRIVRPTLVRSKHTICRVCTAKGNLSEVIFTASKHGKITYHCARSSKWGDLLPVTVDFQTFSENDGTDEESNSSDTAISNNEKTVCSNSEVVGGGIEAPPSKDCVKTPGDYT